MDELFSMPEVKSPRLKWMEQHGISIEHMPDKLDPFVAIVNGKQVAAGTTEEWACWAAAKRLKVKSWNEP